MANAYGDWLRSQREAQGMTQQELADTAIMTRSHIAHVEAGRRTPSREDAQRLDRALNTGNVLSSFLPQDNVAVAHRFEAVRQLERHTTAIREFAPSLVPGILQTETYMRAVLGTATPPWDADQCDRIVVTRLERAKILDNPVIPVMWVVLDEAVLRRSVGGPDIMVEQIAHIVRLVKTERVRVHVLPFSSGAHSLQQSMVMLMWFEDQPPVAYTESLYTSELHDSPAMVERIRSAYDRALGDALPPNESLALLKATAEDYRHND